jgi:thiamine kinase-like enzyme
MQIESTAQKKYFELFGVTDFSLDIFEAKFKLLINTNESCGYGIIFNERDKTLILRKISFLVRKIQKFGIPMTLEHGDLHLANFVGTNSSSIRIIDWSEVSYTHPFFSLYFLFWNSNKLSASLKKSLTISYLSEWSSFGSILDLQKLLSYTNQLAIIFYAYRYLIIANKLSGDLREDFMSFFQNQMAAFKNIAGPNDV